MQLEFLHCGYREMVGIPRLSPLGRESRQFKASKFYYFVPNRMKNKNACLINSIVFSPLVVGGGLYTFHSIFVPYKQENFTLNNCWKSFNGEISISPYCQVFRAIVPALYKNSDKSKDTVSFESVCLPGYFVKQKNYRFVLEQRDGSTVFGIKRSLFPIKI